MNLFTSILIALFAIINRIEAGVLHGLDHDAGVQIANHEVPQEYHIPEPAHHQHEVQTIVKQVEVPFFVDKHVHINRAVPVPVDRVVRVDRPFDVVKYVPKPYIVKVERPRPVTILKQIPLPQAHVQVEPIIQNDVWADPHHGYQHQQSW